MQKAFFFFSTIYNSKGCGNGRKEWTMNADAYPYQAHMMQV